MKVKTSELTGCLLDWAVAQCEGLDLRVIGTVYQHVAGCKHDRNGDPCGWHASKSWDIAGPIIERAGIAIRKIPGVYTPGDYGWEADRWNFKFVDPMRGPTPIIAALRCYVEFKLGPTVELNMDSKLYEALVGRPDEMDDLERVNCDKAGEPGHEYCGWNALKNMPVFMVGKEEKQK